jgi:hypothetical protein
MKRNRTVHNSGPYVVKSHSQGEGRVYLAVYPAFPKYGEEWPVTRASAEGGGPGVFSCMVLADELQAFLNQGYPEAQVAAWAAMVERVKTDPAIKARWEQAMRSLAQEGG